MTWFLVLVCVGWLLVELWAGELGVVWLPVVFLLLALTMLVLEKWYRR